MFAQAALGAVLEIFRFELFGEREVTPAFAVPSKLKTTRRDRGIGR